MHGRINADFFKTTVFAGETVEPGACKCIDILPESFGCASWRGDLAGFADAIRDPRPLPASFLPQGFSSGCSWIRSPVGSEGGIALPGVRPPGSRGLVRPRLALPLALAPKPILSSLRHSRGSPTVYSERCIGVAQLQGTKCGAEQRTKRASRGCGS